VLEPLPPTFTTTRDALHALACFAVSHYRRTHTGRIGLRPTGDGFGTPSTDPSPVVAVRGDRLLHGGGRDERITTIRAACELLGVEPTPDPQVGTDLPPFEPDAELDVDADASLVLGHWYAFGQQVIGALVARRPPGSVSEAQLWPEHFDLAVVVQLDTGSAVNVGVSPGDHYHEQPYVYVGPHHRVGLVDPYWNAPFGALLPHADLLDADDPLARASAFVDEGLERATR
jgi:hypothetical protein